MNISALAFLPLAPMLFAFSGSPAPDGNSRIADQASFAVIGIEVRTNNSLEATGQGKIPQQWKRFFEEDVAGKIASKTGPDIIVVYSNYQSDKSGDYDYLIGLKVNDPSQIPAGMVARTIPAGKYAVVTTAAGPVGQVVSNAWKTIWAAEEKLTLGGVRAYRSDFEIYDQRSRDPQHSQVDIYVGLK